MLSEKQNVPFEKCSRLMTILYDGHNSGQALKK